MKFNFKKNMSQSIILKTNILVVSLIVAIPAFADGNFTQTCKNVHLNGSYLSAECMNYNQQTVNTSIDLNSYITNNNGGLGWQRNGGYAGSVKNCSTYGATLECQTRNRSGKYNVSRLNLDERISNNGGNLIYTGP